MPFNGSGVYARSYRWRDDRDASIKIRADRHDANDDDFELAINSVVNQTQAFIAPVKVPDGTAALPGFTFSADTTTGVYRKGDGTLGFSEGGVEIGPFATAATLTDEINLLRHQSMITAAHI